MPRKKQDRVAPECAALLALMDEHIKGRFPERFVNYWRERIAGLACNGVFEVAASGKKCLLEDFASLAARLGRAKAKADCARSILDRYDLSGALEDDLWPY